MNAQKQPKPTILARVAAAPLLTGILLLAATTPAVAADVDFNGSLGSGATSPGDNILVAIGTNTTTYTHTHTAPDGTQVTGTVTLGTPVLRTSNDAISLAGATAGGGITIKPASGDGTVWAVIDGNASDTAASRRRLIAISEPTNTAQGSNYVINLDNVMLTNGYAGTSSSGGAMRINGGTVNTPDVTVAGNAIFYNNKAGRVGGAMQAGSSGLIFTGAVIFDSNYAGTADGLAFSSYHGGAIALSIGSTATGTLALAFKNDVSFLNNIAGGQGGAINSGNNLAGSTITQKTIEFYGNAIFEGNVGGATAADANGKVTAISTGHNGGAIYANTGTPLIFSGSGFASFVRNLSSGIGGGIYSRSSEVRFVDDPASTFTGNRAFTFTRNVSNTSNTGNGGGAIHINDNKNTSNLIFDAKNSTINASYNAATKGQGGAFRVGGSVYMLQGNFTFFGNQAGFSGGAIAASNGGFSTGKSNRVELRSTGVFESNLAASYGGAIYAAQSGNNSMLFSTESAGSSILFKNNAAGLGGAIYIGNSGTISLNALEGDITFTGNRHKVTFAGALDALLIHGGSGDSTAGFLSADFTTGVPNDIYFAANDLTLALNADAGRVISFDGGLAGADSTTTLTVRKTGLGDVVFGVPSNHVAGSNTNDITATTTVTEGVFRLTGGAQWGSGAGSLTVSAGATLGGHGTYNDNVTIDSNASILVGDKNASTAQKLVFAQDLTLGDTTYYYDLVGSTGAADTYDQLVVNGSLTFAGTQTFDITGIGSGTYTLITSDNVITANTPVYQLQSNGAALTTRYTITSPIALSPDGKSLSFASTMSNLAVKWNAAAGNIWQDNVGANWTTDADANEFYFRNGDTVTFPSVASGTIAVAAAGVKAAGIAIDTDSGRDYTFTGGSITTSALPSDTTLTTPDANAKLVKTGAGTLTFANAANTFAAGIDIDAGTLAFNSGDQLATGPGGAITFTGDATLKANPSAATSPINLASAIVINPAKTATIDLSARGLTLTGDLSGSGNMLKTGTNVLTFAGNGLAYTGAITIDAGVLTLDSTAALGGSITLTGNAALTGSGTATGSLTAASGASIQAGDGTSPSTLTLGTVAIDNTTLKFGLYGGTNAATGYNNSDTLNVSSLTATGSNTIDIFGDAQRGDYYLGNISVLNTPDTIVTLNGFSQIPGARQGASIVTSATNSADLLLRYSADYSRNITWTGSSNSGWDIGSDNWSGSDNVTKFGSGDTVIFAGASTVSSTINILGSSQQSVGDIIIQGDANYTFTGQGIKASAASVIQDALSENLATAQGKLVKTGSGTLTFDNDANLFTGGIDITGGVIAFNAADQIVTDGTAFITFDGDATLRADADAMILGNNIQVLAGKTGAIDTQANALMLTGTLGGGGVLAKAGSGTLAFTGDGTSSTGTIALNEGVLILASSVPFAAAVDAATDTILAATGTLSGKVSIAEGAALVVGLDSTDAALDVSNLHLANDAILTSAPDATTVLSGTVTLGAASSDLAAIAIIGEDTELRVTAAIQGPGGINKTGDGALTLVGDDAIAYAGATQITEGILRLRDIAAPSTFSKDINLAGGWLDISTGTGVADETTATRWDSLPGALSYTGTSGGVIGANDLFTYTTGTIAYAHAGSIYLVVNPGDGNTLTLAGNNSANTGNIRIDSGTLDIAESANLGGGSNTIVFNGGQLHVTATTGNAGSSNRNVELRADATITVDGATVFAVGEVSETGTPRLLTKKGDGTLTLGAASTRSGDTNLEEGTISMIADNALGTGAFNVAGASGTLSFNTGNITVSNTIFLGANTLSINSANSGTLNAEIIGTGGITKFGSNTLTITKASEYSGPTTVATGTLRAGTADVLSPNSDFSINGGSSATTTTFPALDLQGFDQTVASLFSRGNVYLNGATLTLGSGNGTFTNAGYLYIGSGATPGTHAHIRGNLVGETAIYSGTTVLYGRPSSITIRIGLDDDGLVAAHDKLTVHGNVTGQNTLIFAMSGSSVTPSGTGGVGGALTPILVPSVNNIVAQMSGVALIEATGDMAADAFVRSVYPNRVYDADGNELIPHVDTAGNITTLGAAVSPEIPATIAIDATAYLVGKTTIDSLNQRVVDLRLDSASNMRHGMDLWLHGLKTGDRIRGSTYKDSDVSSHGAQIGLDYSDFGGDDTRFILGIFGDYMSSELKQTGIAKTKAEVYGCGIYGSYQRGAFSLDLIARASKDDYTISVANAPDFELDGTTVGGSVQMSYAINFESISWTLEPQIQGVVQRHKINSASDSLGRPFTFDSIDSLSGRVGLLVWRKYDGAGSITVIPRLRLSVHNEFRTKTTLHYGRTDYSNNLSQTAGQVDMGVMFRMADWIETSAGVSFFYGNKIGSLSLDFGMRFRW
ncbi:autotransporter-associated beta strand repeat-containing protein [Ereboglobus luteus]|uniref:Autotransporter domain-containing protein n=1 Tax=Ereboglobus luteus TaxID=1796921 RepID=A0A2U8E459_9BACT|nr:autotransporter-associated beta strand repeat-containing protein [Ereboglobus luteus]AWI09708.1 hypothetical protein CKA38_10995 [Ereboglobus luteus]